MPTGGENGGGGEVSAGGLIGGANRSPPPLPTTAAATLLSDLSSDSMQNGDLWSLVENFGVSADNEDVGETGDSPPTEVRDGVGRESSASATENRERFRAVSAFCFKNFVKAEAEDEEGGEPGA